MPKSKGPTPWPKYNRASKQGGKLFGALFAFPFKVLGAALKPKKRPAKRKKR